MDFRLKGAARVVTKEEVSGFNPCSNGLSAQRGIVAGDTAAMLTFQSLF